MAVSVTLDMCMLCCAVPQVREFIEGIGVENIGKRLINSREGKVRLQSMRQAGRRARQVTQILHMPAARHSRCLISTLSLSHTHHLTPLSPSFSLSPTFRLTSRSLPCPWTPSSSTESSLWRSRTTSSACSWQMLTSQARSWQAQAAVPCLRATRAPACCPGKKPRTRVWWWFLTRDRVWRQLRRWLCCGLRGPALLGSCCSRLEASVCVWCRGDGGRVEGGLLALRVKTSSRQQQWGGGVLADSSHRRVCRV